jgi:hypothetical protein
VSNVITHPAWTERISFYETLLGGQWTWKMRNDTAAILIDPDENEVAAALPDLAPGLAAALNTTEGRMAYARARLD